ncbi:unnamed protein product [Lactuca virosa]|uniref:Uncharacterized protein n=1 Tax=Lactuca virosa TaxID=75947 RepID=A0AAU9N4S8_9ASTR|nr:unnamed protein product [Lactuca virosa]
MHTFSVLFFKPHVPSLAIDQFLIYLLSVLIQISPAVSPVLPSIAQKNTRFNPFPFNRLAGLMSEMEKGMIIVQRISGGFSGLWRLFSPDE